MVGFLTSSAESTDPVRYDTMLLDIGHFEPSLLLDTYYLEHITMYPAVSLEISMSEQPTR